jgi:hypothetical protein
MPVWFSAFHWHPVRSTKKMASIAARSGTRGLWQPSGCFGRGGSSGSIFAHNASGSRQPSSRASRRGCFSLLYSLSSVVDRDWTRDCLVRWALILQLPFLARSAHGAAFPMTPSGNRLVATPPQRPAQDKAQPGAGQGLQLGDETADLRHAESDRKSRSGPPFLSRSASWLVSL